MLMCRSLPRSHHSRLAVATCLVLCGVSSSIAGGVQQQRPNFIFILTDDQRHDAVGCAGNPQIHTPTLDRLCAQGMRFRNAFVTTSLCSPSRATCLTGRYASAHGVVGLGGRLRPGEQTLPGILAAAGYRTAVAGKWHLGNRPAELGFERAVTFVSNGRYYGRPVTEEGREREVPGHIDRYCADRAVEMIRQWDDEPFFLWFCAQLPHMNHEHRWDARQQTLDKYDASKLTVPITLRADLTGKPPYLLEARPRTQAQDTYGYADADVLREHIRDYYAVITEMDEILGGLIKAVDDLGLRERTYIVFMGDNGWFLGEHGLTSKVLAYEASIRVPLIVTGPRLTHGTDDHLVLNVDIAPTILELAGVNVPESMQGQSLVPLLRGQAVEWRSSFLYEVPKSQLGVWPLLAVRTDRYKYIRTLEPESPGRAAFEELYDLQQDPHEIWNVAKHPMHRPRRDDLVRLMDEHHRRIGDRVRHSDSWTEN